MDILKLLNNLDKVDFEVALRDTLHDNQTRLVEQQQQQWLRGENADGDKIGKYKNKYYRRKKFEMNVLAGYGNVDLRLTGEFYRETKVFFFSTSFFFKSTDWKTEKLSSMYGGEEVVFGLNKKTKGLVVKSIINPEATKRIINQIHSR